MFFHISRANWSSTARGSEKLLSWGKLYQFGMTMLMPGARVFYIHFLYPPRYHFFASISCPFPAFVEGINNFHSISSSLSTQQTLDITWLPPHQYQRNGLIIEYHIFYSMGGTTRRRNITVTRNFYSWTLRNLDEGRKYFVEIAAKTHAGLGPFSNKKSCTVLRVSSARGMCKDR